MKEENIKVTISLKKSSIAFFKKEAQKHHTSYQRMIRRLIDLYTSRHQRVRDISQLRTTIDAVKLMSYLQSLPLVGSPPEKDSDKPE